MLISQLIFDLTYQTDMFLVCCSEYRWPAEVMVVSSDDDVHYTAGKRLIRASMWMGFEISGLMFYYQLAMQKSGESS